MSTVYCDARTGIFSIAPPSRTSSGPARSWEPLRPPPTARPCAHDHAVVRVGDDANTVARAEYERGLSHEARERHLTTIRRIIEGGTDTARIEPYLATVPGLVRQAMVERGVMVPQKAKGADTSHGLPEAPRTARTAEEGQGLRVGLGAPGHAGKPASPGNFPRMRVELTEAELDEVLGGGG